MQNGKVLHPVNKALRHPNFLKFVDLYFTKIRNPGNRDVWSDNYGQPTRLEKNSDGYKAFSRFAQTDYGSVVIKEMLDNTSKYQGFDIMENTGKAASGDYGGLTLPSKFPYRDRFLTSGQKVFDLAIIYHELAHTKVFRPESSKNKAIDIYDERIAVLKFENPVRMRHGYEPRYSYTMNNGSQTINIITGKVVNGKMHVSKYNPAILVPPISRDALK